MARNVQYAMMKSTQCNLVWLTIFAYVSQINACKKQFWNDMFNFSRGCTLLWAIIRDLNDILDASEKKRGNCVDYLKCRTFWNCINSCIIMEIPMVGTKFTWRGPINQNYDLVFEKLDRGLSNDEWRLSLVESMIIVLPRLKSFDHHPLLRYMKDTVNDRRDRPFRFKAT